MYNTPPQIFRIELIDVSNVEKCELHWLRKFCFLQRAFFFFLNNDVTLIWLNSHSFNQTTVFDWQNSTKNIHQAEILLQPFWRAAFTKQVARGFFRLVSALRIWSSQSIRPPASLVAPAVLSSFAVGDVA